jgi:hypothetical protein
MKALAKYLLTLGILLISGYVLFSAQIHNTETSLKDLKGREHSGISSEIQDHPNVLFYNAASIKTKRAESVIAETEVEEKEGSRKQSEKCTTLFLAVQVPDLLLRNNKISSSDKNCSYTSSYRYLIFRSFRI